MSRDLNGGRERDGKAEEPLRFGPEREPQGDTPNVSTPIPAKSVRRN